MILEKVRCEWAMINEEEMKYHDQEWGVPIHDDQKLFELLILEGMQAGLSWDCILKKRENFRKAFDFFDVEKVSKYDQNKIDSLLLDKGIIRNRLKINGSVKNAKAFLQIQEEFSSFDTYFWAFVNGTPVKNTWKSHKEVPATTKLSDIISKDLKKRGFTFVGSTIVYAYMQSAGLVNDHTIDCFRYEEV